MMSPAWLCSQDLLATVCLDCIWCVLRYHCHSRSLSALAVMLSMHAQVFMTSHDACIPYVWTIEEIKQHKRVWSGFTLGYLWPKPSLKHHAFILLVFNQAGKMLTFFFFFSSGPNHIGAFSPLQKIPILKKTLSFHSVFNSLFFS